jgi:hypothetical protein
MHDKGTPHEQPQIIIIIINNSQLGSEDGSILGVA